MSRSRWSLVGTASLALVLGLGLGGCTLPDGGTGAGTASSAPTTAASPLHQPTVTSQPLSIPQIRLAEETACLTDAQTIRMAEYYYWTVNGHFASMDQLVTAHFLRSVSEYFSSVLIGAPVGGYTLAAVPSGPCGPHVVTAAENAG